MVTTPQSRALPFLAGALVIAALAGGGVALYWSGQADGKEGERKTWQAKWDEEATRQATARTKAELEAREEELRRQAEIDEVREHAQEQIAQAQADADAAGLESGRLREQARRLAARASQCTAIPGLPKEARQPDILPWCSPTCSAGLTKERGSWQQRMTELERQD